MTHSGFSHRFRAASSTFLVYTELTEVSFGACRSHQGVGDHPAFKDGWERLQYLLFGCPIFIYVARFPFEESLLTLGYGLLGPERGPHSPQPWVTLRARPAWVQCQGFMVTLLPRVCPDRSIPVRNTLLWSGSWSQGAVPALASLASPQFLKLIFVSNAFSSVLLARLGSVAST